MIRTVMFVSSRRDSSFEERESFWLSFGRFVRTHFSRHSSEDNETDYSDSFSSEENETDYSDSFSSTDTMDDLDDIFDGIEGDFDDITIYESGYEADSEDDSETDD